MLYPKQPKKMELCDLITEIKRGDFSHAQETDFSLVGNIINELEVAKENPARAKLFGDARQLNDVILEPYLRLDEAVKQEMAEVYEKEDCFQVLRLIPYGTKQRLNEQYGKEIMVLLHQISIYSKLIPILEHLVQWANGKENPKTSDVTIFQYLSTHTLSGGEVLRNSKSMNSMEVFYHYNFQSGERQKKLTPKKVFDSITYGVSSKLKKRILEAVKLLPQRIKFIQNYINYIGSHPNPNISNTGLWLYMVSHNALGNSVKGASSLENWYNYDFVNEKIHEAFKVNEMSIFESLTLGIPEEIKKEFKEAIELIPIRRKIIRNYIDFIKTHPDPIIKKCGFPYYLMTHNIDGKLVLMGKNSLISFYRWDFKNKKHVDNATKDEVYQSMTCGLEEDILVELRESMELLPVRIRILENYISHVGNLKNPNPSETSLYAYSKKFSTHGQQVKTYKGSCVAIFHHNFKTGETDSLTNKTALESLSHGVPEDLKERVIKAQILLEKREKAMKNYIEWVNHMENPMPSNVGLHNYLSTHDEDGNSADYRASESLFTWYNYDFENTGSYANIGKHEKMNQEIVLGSLTYKFSDELKQQVKEAMSLKKFRKDLLTNYVRHVEETGQTSFYGYIRDYDLSGNHVSDPKEASRNFAIAHFPFAEKIKDHTILSLIKNLSFDIEDQEIVEKVRKYALAA